jgi:hypothetical protein
MGSDQWYSITGSVAGIFFFTAGIGGTCFSIGCASSENVAESLSEVLFDILLNTDFRGRGGLFSSSSSQSKHNGLLVSFGIEVF